MLELEPSSMLQTYLKKLRLSFHGVFLSLGAKYGMQMFLIHIVTCMRALLN